MDCIRIKLTCFVFFHAGVSVMRSVARMAKSVASVSANQEVLKGRKGSMRADVRSKLKAMTSEQAREESR